jgi:hypothetical protein
MNSIHDDYNTQPQSDEYATEHEEVRDGMPAMTQNLFHS